MIDFKAELSEIGELQIIRIPIEVSKLLTSRGMVMIQLRIILEN